MSADGTKRPKGSTMEGMIWNANDILAKAGGGDGGTIPKELFENCRAVIILSSVQVGFVFTNCVGSGIALARDRDTGKWSLPCACSLSGLGIGLIAGGAHSDIIVFAMDDSSMSDFVGGGNLFMSKERTGAEIGAFDRGAHSDLEGRTVAFTYSKGAFVGAAIHGANITVHVAENYNFYDQDVSTTEILYGHSSRAMPGDKVTVMDEVYTKLDLLSRGESVLPEATEKQNAEAAKENA